MQLLLEGLSLLVCCRCLLLFLLKQCCLSLVRNSHCWMKQTSCSVMCRTFSLPSQTGAQVWLSRENSTEVIDICFNKVAESITLFCATVSFCVVLFPYYADQEVLCQMVRRYETKTTGVCVLSQVAGPCHVICSLKRIMKKVVWSRPNMCWRQDGQRSLRFRKRWYSMWGGSGKSCDSFPHLMYSAELAEIQPNPCCWCQNALLIPERNLGGPHQLLYLCNSGDVGILH